MECEEGREWRQEAVAFTVTKKLLGVEAVVFC